MQHISLQGFKNIPQSNIVLRLNSKVRLINIRSKILWQNSRLQKNKVFISFGGTLVESKKNGPLLRFVKALNAGDTCLVSQFIKPSDKVDLESLGRLTEAGALTV